MTTTTLSEFIQRPTKVIEHLDEGDVLLTRRGRGTLRLSLAERDEAEVGTLQLLAQMIAASLDDEVADRIAGQLSSSQPWIELLPEEQRRQFVGAFLRLARASVSVHAFERMPIFLEAWRATAEAYADPSATPDGSDLTYLDEVEPVVDPRGL